LKGQIQRRYLGQPFLAIHQLPMVMDQSLNLESTEALLNLALVGYPT
jgi:hypothetical protein